MGSVATVATVATVISQPQLLFPVYFELMATLKDKTRRTTTPAGGDWLVCPLCRMGYAAQSPLWTLRPGSRCGDLSQWQEKPCPGRLTVGPLPPLPQDFWPWLMAQRDREDPIGDVARDAAEDRHAPRDADRWPGYVFCHPTASTEAKHAARDAVQEWKQCR